MNILKDSTKLQDDRLAKMKRALVDPKENVSFTISIPAKLHTQFKAKTASERISMTEIVVAAIEKYLAK
jgi:predicted HicB family RNase H-like nuclease